MHKYKIVFLGDQSVGKTSIINRFIFDNFTGNEQVLIFKISSPLSESILFPKPCKLKTNQFGSSFGTPPVRKDSVPSFRATFEIRRQPSFASTSRVDLSGYPR